ncbi:MAG: chitobiase/beta-hexosaminidase C-terminal domain-containing protein [Prevotella sp.]|nr:chitobiase/beta-hexosaminidase C-terminal domain-containing protein [Prevotella sp.]
MKKLFTLLTLLLTLGGATSAWGEATTIYSMTNVTGPTTNVESKTTVDIVATFVGGSAQAYNGKSSSAALADKSGNIKLSGSSDSYFHAILTGTETIAEGDIITCASGTLKVSATSTKGSSVTFPYTVPSGSPLIGQKDVYLWKDGANSFTSFTITRPGADDVANPVITQSGSSVTITCSTDGATIYYTTDGSEPTSSSTAYSDAITIDNPCTVRAIAIKGENASSLMLKDCYVSHASAKVVLGYSGGSVSGDVWTSTDGNYILTDNVADRGINAATLAATNDAFKLNHTDTYTLKISNNIKVTKIVVVGKSWLKGSAGNASTLAFDGFTPASGSFFDFVDETYVNTIEFTPESELGYGASIIMRPSTNQLGAYIEIYGEEYASSVTTYDTPVTWDFTSWSDATITGVTGDGTNWYTNEKSDNSGVDMTGNIGRTNIGSLSNNSLSYSGTNIAETDGLKFSSDAYGLALLFNLQELSGMSPDGGYHSGKYIWLYNTNTKIKIENVTKGSIIEIGLEPHKKNDARGLTLTNSTQTQGDAKPNAYQVCKWTVTADGDVTITPTKGLHIYYITLTKANEAVSITPAKATTTYVTTKALDFSAVEGLKAYAATTASASAVTLTEVGAVPAGTPLVLIGTASTEYTVPVAASASAPAANLLVAGDGTTEIGGDSKYDYVLSSGVFHRANAGTVAVGKAYLHLDSAPAARELTISFGDATVISAIAKSQEPNANGYYNLAGQRVAQPTKGLYIKDGKKVIIK